MFFFFIYLYVWQSQKTRYFAIIEDFITAIYSFLIKQFLLLHDRRIIIVSVFVFIINYVVVFPMFCFTCLPIYPDKMISWSSLKISDGAWKQFQRIKKIPPSKNSERGSNAFCKPRQPRNYLVFFITGLAYIFIFFNFLIRLLPKPLRHKCPRRFQDLPRLSQREQI